MRRILPFLIMLLAGCVTPVEPPHGAPIVMVPVNAPALPQAGAIAHYTVRNAYNGETVGDVEYRVEKLERDRVIVAVNPTAASVGAPRTEVYAADGNWLRHPVLNHNQLIDYEFAEPYPAYVFPLETARTWSRRVNARNPATGQTRSIRVDGEVLGAERITTPAGAFDTVKIRRRVYAGDWDGFLFETNITEYEWYASELGRAVRLERNSTWQDTSRGMGPGGMFGFFNNNQTMRGDWYVFELTSAPASNQCSGGAPEIKPAAPAGPR
jgi:hypothetical protein